VRYIADELEAPRAVEKFISKLDREVQKIADNPFRCHLYVPTEKLKHEYRVLHIDNYSLFYEAGNGKIEIYRVIYSKRDILQLLNE
jgi:plasmid stabilization system protein ParE